MMTNEVHTHYILIYLRVNNTTEQKREPSPWVVAQTAFPTKDHLHYTCLCFVGCWVMYKCLSFYVLNVCVCVHTQMCIGVWLGHSVSGQRHSGDHDELRLWRPSVWNWTDCWFVTFRVFTCFCHVIIIINHVIMIIDASMCSLLQFSYI